ncbi:hypothetical protein IWX75_002871 [Arthrobacter sp. CAN_A6]
MIAGQEGLDLVATVRPAGADHPHIGRVIGIRPTPVIEQVIHHRIQPLSGRVPRFEQVVIETDVVDRLDGDIGVRVSREKEELRPWSMRSRALHQLDPRHLRHPLVRRDQCNPLIAQGQLRQEFHGFGAGGSPENPEFRPISVAKVAGNRRGNLRIVVDRQNVRLRHDRMSMVTAMWRGPSARET